MITFLTFAGGVVLLLLTRWVWKHRAHRSRLARWGSGLLAGVLILSALCSFVTSGIAYWYTHRAQPHPRNEEIFHGITYVREVRQSPRPMVIHVAKVDLNAPGISFLVTPGDPIGGRAMKARKTSAFLKEFNVQFAVNANYFYPFKSESPFDFYPHEGDPVDLCGIAASRGNVYSNKASPPGVLYISPKNEASFDEPVGEVWNAIAGNGFLVKAGQSLQPFDGDTLYPRAGLGLDRERRHLLHFIIDGKQPNYSEGATLAELADVMIRHGVWDGVRIDEGGSATMVMRSANGTPRILNSPINHRIPRWERVVANHLGVFAQPKQP